MPPSGEFVPSVTPLGIPWNWVAIRLDHRCPIPPGITPGPKDRLRRCPPWNPLDFGRLSTRIDVAQLVWYNTRPPGFHLPRYFVRKIYSYHLVCCVCVSLRTVLYQPVLCFSFQRTVSYHPVLCSFSENSFIPPGIPSALKKNKFYTTWYFKVLFREQFSLHLTALRLRTKSVYQVLCLAKVNFE